MIQTMISNNRPQEDADDDDSKEDVLTHTLSPDNDNRCCYFFLNTRTVPMIRRVVVCSDRWE